MDVLEKYLSELALLFGYKYDDSFFNYLKTISVPNNSMCGKEIKLGEGGWECKDCEIGTSSIYCNDCFIKEKHIGHKTYFDPGITGFCDCGIRVTIKPEGFCDKHKGEFSNIIDLTDFIKMSIKDNVYNKINDIFNKILLLFIDKIKNYLQKKKENGDEDDEIYEMFDCLEELGNKLYNNNLSLFYYFTLKFTENYPYETYHKCLGYDENKNLVTFIKEEKDKKHICICPFIQVMIYMLLKRNTKQNTSSFFSLFIQTYKNKIVTSLCFMNCFCDLFFYQNLESFREMGFQLISEDLSILVLQEQNKPFLEYFFEDVYFSCLYFFKNKLYENLRAMYFGFYEIVMFLPRKTTFDKINENKKIVNIIIDICCIFNNANLFENKIKYDKFQGDRYDYSLIYIEDKCLSIIISLTHLINFDNKEINDLIFNIIFDKLYKFKKSKDNMPVIVFSPHLIIIKCYSLFLNKYCFNYSIKNKCDLVDSFNHFLELYPEAKHANKFWLFWFYYF